MKVTSPLWMRVIWLGLLIAAFFVPLFFLGLELRSTETCAPDIPWSDYEAVRKQAKWTWAGSLLFMGVLLAAALKYAPSQLGPRALWAGFILWKGMTLVLAFITSPVCFESYGRDDAYIHPLEGFFAMGSMLSWGLLLVLIFIGLITGPKVQED